MKVKKLLKYCVFDCQLTIYSANKFTIYDGHISELKNKQLLNMKVLRYYIRHFDIYNVMIIDTVEAVDFNFIRSLGCEK